MDVGCGCGAVGCGCGAVGCGAVGCGAVGCGCVGCMCSHVSVCVSLHACMCVWNATVCMVVGYVRLRVYMNVEEAAYVHSTSVCVHRHTVHMMTKETTIDI